MKNSLEWAKFGPVENSLNWTIFSPVENVEQFSRMDHFSSNEHFEIFFIMGSIHPC